MDQMREELGEQADEGRGLVAVRLPFPPNLSTSRLTKSDLKKVGEQQETITLQNSPLITLSARKIIRPLYSVRLSQYRNKETGEVVSRIDGTSEIGKLYDYTRMPDFHVHADMENQATLDQMKDMLRSKILDGEFGLDEYQFVATPVEFLKGFNLALNNSDLLVNKLKGLKKQFKSQQIGFGDEIPEGPETLPAYVTKLKIFATVQEYLKKRPCWLRNVLEYQLRIDGFKGQYTTNQLKNILKYLCFTYRDGPWKHVFCRFGFNPTQNKQATLYQTLMVKIKRKELQDYEEKEQQPVEQDVYDPTFREMPTKYLRIYQLCDIEDKQVEELIKVTAVLSEECNKETGWFSRSEFNNLQKIVKSIREERSKN